MGENKIDEEDPERQTMFEQNYPETAQIDPSRARFPCSVVWTPLPFISWLIPFIGHMGICREDGVILDFAGPNFVCVDNFAFGSVTRYLQINKEKDCCNMDDHHSDEANILSPTRVPWDDALQKSTQEYQHHAYSLFTCNCHSFVANNLNRLGFHTGGWNVVNVAMLMFLQGQWVSTSAMVRSYLPFTIICGFGLIFGGSTFFTFWAFFTVVLVGWFLVGTYCLKDLISL